MIIFDDIGSYPLPNNINKNWITGAIRKEDSRSFDIIRDAMRQKVDAGVEMPAYPQFREMSQQFLEIINDESLMEEAMLVRPEKARIMELEAIEEVGREYIKETNNILNVRVCITGPIELYLRQFGATSYKDILEVLSIDIDRFARNSIENAKHFKISKISIDEPSIGINPNIMFNDDDMIDALEKATEAASSYKIDTEIHLHSPLHYNLICRVSSINVIGIESAANPSYTDLIDKKDLEDYDKFLRVGISRTDIFKMAAIINEKFGGNVWKDLSNIGKIISEMENPYIIEKRLEKMYKSFGERIKYAGPDCGLGAWQTQSLAFNLLKNTSVGMREFLHKIGKN